MKDKEIEVMKKIDEWMYVCAFIPYFLQNHMM